MQEEKTQNLGKKFDICTFTDGKGSVFFKALGHPFLQEKRATFRQFIKSHCRIALYDPNGFAQDTLSLLELSSSEIHCLFVQSAEKMEASICGLRPQPIQELPHYELDLLLIADFDGEKAAKQINFFVPPGCTVHDLSSLKLGEEFLTNPRNYLDPLNFATNFAFYQEENGTHTRLVTGNYWHRYGGKNIRLACLLLDQGGQELARWIQPLRTAEHLIVLESQEIRDRFGLPPFTGQLFLHVLGAQGHAIVKYALDIFSDDSTTFGATHDANAWPSDYFAGLPAPRPDEDIILWLQNSHPVAVPPYAVQLQVMGQEDKKIAVAQEIPPFGSLPLSLKDYFPQAVWPEQVEIAAGRHFVRPRYEIASQGHRSICHVNIERDTLVPDPQWPRIASLFGKGYILPSPLLPLERFEQRLLPTPMSRLQKHLPLKILAYDATGKPFAEISLGNLPRNHTRELFINEWLAGKIDPQAQGHLETLYDLEAGHETDGWIHALFRFRDVQTGHMGETTFGSHLFNHIMTYKGEPQAYNGPPPGLSTRLFLRVMPSPIRTFCHLIYPVSTTWNPFSATELHLMSPAGELLETVPLKIPQNGSHLFWVDEVFPKIDGSAPPPFVLIRDVSCRLFGYHGTEISGKAFSIDHMFGF